MSPLMALAIRFEGIKDTLAIVTEQSTEVEGEQLRSSLRFIGDEMERFHASLCELPANPHDEPTEATANEQETQS